ncbi:MAG: hypothetical protein HFG89_02850 [Dorea sp.]|jgi:hypothetical protein|nr:hypothetical protein [Dorea sp.]
MTHTLHRFGTEEELNTDWVVLQLASPINTPGSGPKMMEFCNLAMKNHAVTLGGTKTSEFLEGSKENFLKTVDTGKDDTMAVQATFNNEQDVAGLLKDLKEADLGISVVVSGLTDKVKHMCEEAGTTFHSLTNSLGIWGRQDKIPQNKDVLSIITMCGHSMISETHVLNLAEKIKAGKITARKAALELAYDCTCGIVNPDRCERLLQAVADTIG